MLVCTYGTGNTKTEQQPAASTRVRLQDARNSELRDLRSAHARLQAQLLEATAGAQMHAATQAHAQQLQDAVQLLREELVSAREVAVVAEKRAAQAERVERLLEELGEAHAFASNETVRRVVVLAAL